MTVKEARKAVYDFVHETGLETTKAFSLVELLDDLVEAAKEEQKGSYDGELQRLYHLIYNQAVSAARETFMHNMKSIQEDDVEEEEGLKEAVNV